MSIDGIVSGWKGDLFKPNADPPSNLFNVPRGSVVEFVNHEGTLLVSINGEQVELQNGDSLFINGRQIINRSGDPVSVDAQGVETLLPEGSSSTDAGVTGATLPDRPRFQFSV